MTLKDNFMIRTANHEIYEELQQKKKIFKLQIHLFSFALIMGLLNNKKSTRSVSHDIIRLRGLASPELKLHRKLIELVSNIISENEGQEKVENELLKYADGGLEMIWEQYVDQGIIDFPRIFEETQIQWVARSKVLLKNFKEK